MTDDQIRIGTAERDDALQALGEHLSAGRLDLDEYSERSARVAASKTIGDLEPLFVDLPEPRVHRIVTREYVPQPPPMRAPSRGRAPERWLYSAVTIMLFIAFVAAVFLSKGHLWFLFFMVPMARAFIIPKHHRRAVRGGYGKRW